MRAKIRQMTVNKHRPQIEFSLWHSNEKGYCPVANREIIGICNARHIIKSVLKLGNTDVERVLNKIQDEDKVLVFGKDIDPFFEKRVKVYPNVFFLGVFNE
jgi:hypothetical protein